MGDEGGASSRKQLDKARGEEWIRTWKMRIKKKKERRKKKNKMK